ncbi:hypothetical protein C9374_012733 [Naegleria lovaniensis]|uniref:Uncharacterized protein n=1 Tax=Naegleria lovaniensis TaxID=51637 RepID=A0AA88KQH5_NAELO|nr:uncharacterized protein C9374_012733 [Naegleria lovaniensis]KAG2392481.1 hypothetical protein C9374_012733 [Naegleria lovaniensis]
MFPQECSNLYQHQEVITVNPLDPTGLFYTLLQRSSRQVIRACSVQDLEFICKAFHVSFLTEDVEACIETLFEKGICKEAEEDTACTTEELMRVIAYQRDMCELSDFSKSFNDCSVFRPHRESEVDEDVVVVGYGLLDELISNARGQLGLTASKARTKFSLFKNTTPSFAEKLANRIKMMQATLARLQTMENEMVKMKHEHSETKNRLEATETRVQTLTKANGLLSSRLSETETRLAETKQTLTKANDLLASRLRETESRLNETESRLHNTESKLQQGITQSELLVNILRGYPNQN